MRKALAVYITLSLALAVSSSLTMAQSAGGDTQSGYSERAARLRRQIDETRKTLDKLEQQLAIEEEEQQEEAAHRQAAMEAAEERRAAVANPDLGTKALSTPVRRNLENTFIRNIIVDQRNIWTSPSRLRLGDASWAVPAAAATITLIGSDVSIEKVLPTSPSLIQRSKSFSDYGIFSMAGATGGLFVWGSLTHNPHQRETGFLAGEAAVNSFLMTEAIKNLVHRERPLEGNHKGDFFQSGGSSFPSAHSAVAWSIASVFAHEYPGPLTKILAYGAATAIGATRVTGRQHFASDVFIGAAMGWYAGREVYRAHHSPELNGAEWGTFQRTREAATPDMMGSAYVPPDSWVYPAFDRLTALGYVHTGFASMRPWTRLECARLLEEAAPLIADSPALSEAAKLYSALKYEFSFEGAERAGGQNLGAQLESVYTRFTGISGTPLTDGYHFAQTLVNDYGRPYGRGFSYINGLSARAEAGPFAFYVRGEYQHAPAAPTVSDQVLHAEAVADLVPGLPPVLGEGHGIVNRFRLLDAYVTVNLKNNQLSFGKQSLWWGPGQSGPMLFSDNAEPITMLRYDRISPFKLPSIFSFLGPVRAQFFVGQLSGQELVDTEIGFFGISGRPVDPQPFIFGHKFSFKPTPNLEFSVTRTQIFGGPNFPFNFHRFFNALFSFSVAAATDPGERWSGVDFTYRIPKLRNRLLLYGDGFTQDEISPLAYPTRAAFNGGIYVPRLPGLKKTDFRIEGVYTNLFDHMLFPGFFYYKGRYLSGYTNNGQLMGNWIGRDSRGVQAWTTYWLSSRSNIQLTYREQGVARNFLQGGRLQDFGTRADLLIRPDLGISSLLQYEHWNFPLLSTKAQSNFTASVQLTFWPAWVTKRSKDKAVNSGTSRTGN